MTDAISTVDDRLRLVVALAENDLESVGTEIRDDVGTPYQLRARALDDGSGDGPVVRIEESIATDGEEFLTIAEYDREAIDGLAVMHRKQVRELHVRRNHPQSHLEHRQNGRERQQVRNRKALREAFDDARVESLSRSEQVIDDA